jgi:hypothetical protein
VEISFWSEKKTKTRKSCAPGRSGRAPFLPAEQGASGAGLMKAAEPFCAARLNFPHSDLTGRVRHFPQKHAYPFKNTLSVNAQTNRFDHLFLKS